MLGTKCLKADCARMTPLNCAYCVKHCLEMSASCGSKAHAKAREDEMILEKYRNKPKKGSSDATFRHEAETNFNHKGETITIWCIRTFVLTGAANDALEKERRRLRVQGKAKRARPALARSRRLRMLRERGAKSWRRKQGFLLGALGS